MGAKKLLVILIAVVGLGGCGKAWEENTEDDQERAREVLVIALDAWKSGQTASLAKRDPPIRFGDDDQLSGLKLTDYELADPDVSIHPFRDVAVTLTLQDGAGRALKKVAAYQVGLDPHVTVLRSDN